MKISCPSCSAKYSIADEKVQNRLAKIRCRKCGTSIVIDGNVSPANVYAADGGAAGAQAPAAAAPAGDAGTTYSVDLGENDQRQMTVPEIVDAYNAGTLTAETFVWADGFADWTALAQVEELVAALHAAAQESPALTDETSAASASTAPQESPWDHHSAAAPAGGGPDLFGNVSSAGGVDEQPALGAAVPSAEPSPFGASGGLQDATGARNESSVLFSLSALTSSASTSRPSVPAPAASAGNNDDSGLIDLKALTAAAEATAHVPNAPMPAPVHTPLAAAPLGGSPLGASPLGGGGIGGTSIPPQAAKSNNNVLIIGGFLFAGIVAAAAIMTLGGKEQEPAVAPPAPVVAPTPAAAPAPEPVPTASTGELPTSDAKPPSTGTEEEEDAPKAAPKTSPRPKSTSSPKPSGSPAPAAAPAPAPAPKPSMGKCGCKKDDLMCLMNCAQ